MKLLALLFCFIVSACTDSSTNDASIPSDENGVGQFQNDVPAEHSQTGPNPELKSATYFADPTNRERDIDIIRENTDAEVTINGHYSQAAVPCGTGCISYWIIDRRTGAIMDLPSGLTDTDVIYDVKGQIGSDIVEVTYGPVGLSSDACSVQKFKLTGTTFKGIGEVAPATCS